MSRRRSSPASLLLAIAGVSVLALAVGAHAAQWARAGAPVGQPASPLAAPPAPGLRPAQYPCDPTLARQVSPRIVSADRGTIDVGVNVDYHCVVGKKPVYFFVMVENTDKLTPPGWGGRDLIKNVRQGLTDFVKNVDFTNGTQGGMIIYNANVLVNEALEGGESGKRGLTSAIDRFATTSNASARAAGEAIDKATDLLTAANPPTDTMKLLLILDGGAPFTGADVDVDQACEAAKAAGVTIAVFALPDASNRLAGCADQIQFSQRPSGEDIPDRLGPMADSLLSGDQLSQLKLTDSLADEFEYVSGSASPKEPVKFLNDISWDINPPPPPGGHNFSYKARVKEGTQPGIYTLSRSFTLELYYVSGGDWTIRQANPGICVYPPADESFCDDFVATLTPPAPTTTAPATATPTDTPSAPAVTATETPTATPEATEEPEAPSVYVPMVARSAELNGR